MLKRENSGQVNMGNIFPLCECLKFEIKQTQNIFKESKASSTEKVIWGFHKVKNSDIWAAKFSAMDCAVTSYLRNEECLTDNRKKTVLAENPWCTQHYPEKRREA